MIEVSVARVNSVVAEVIHDDQVARQRIFRPNQDSHSVLAVNRVRQGDTELSKHERHVAGAVKASRGLAAEDIRSANILGGDFQDGCAI